MPTSLSKPDNGHSDKRWVMRALLAYGAMCVGLLGYFLVFPDEATLKAQSEKRLVAGTVQPVQKQGRYEGVIANWDRYRARNKTAEAK